MSRTSGCAAKISPAELNEILRNLPPTESDLLLASWAHGEDAALWEIDSDRLGILTLDFITPVVDDPGRFGEIAAANALSDVFAMGGRPLVALNVVCYPTAREPIETLREILAGGARKAKEAGAAIAGGHSVQDEEPKYGLVVFGETDRGLEWRVSGAKAGDSLILTKPLGTGIITTAIKAGLLPEEHLAPAIESMTKLNDLRGANIGRGLREAIHACTDVTGFGLAGHASDMLDDGIAIMLYAKRLPILPGAADMAAMGMIPAGSYSNKHYSEKRVVFESSDKRTRSLADDIIYDPQTSGGLLLAVESDAALELLSLLRPAFPMARRIGEFCEGRGNLRVV
jgi:selenide,water dikinase